MKVYDALIIGAGQADNPLAKKLAGAGWKTALIEIRLLTKFLLRTDGCFYGTGSSPRDALLLEN